MSIAQLGNSYAFPHPTHALVEPNGLLAFGGDLCAERLRVAYHEGIFPWFSPDELPLWWSPDPRAVLIPGELHTGRTLRRFIRKLPYQITVNYAFDQVIYGCAQRQEGTWIGSDVQQGYQALHQEGQAHSIEVWYDCQLVGGLYGVNVGTLFCGESMFSKMENASKCAFVAFYHHFLHHGGQLLDCQVLNHHTKSLGAKIFQGKNFSSIFTYAESSHCRQDAGLLKYWIYSQNLVIYAVHGGNVDIHYEENDGLKYDIPLHNEGFSALSCRLKTMVVTFRGLDGQRRQY